MSNYSIQYTSSSYASPQRINYSSYQNNYPSYYSSYYSSSVYPSTKYSNNLNNFNYGPTNGYNNYNNSYIQAKVNHTNFSSSNYNYNYITSKTQILPPKTYYSYESFYPMDTKYYPNNNMTTNNNDFIKTSYQPSYINVSYSNNVNNKFPKASYNIITTPINVMTNRNVLELTANSTKSMAYGTTINHIPNETNLTFNNYYVINSNNSIYTSQINPQNSLINYNVPPHQNVVQYNPNLVSQLKRSYFNEKNLPYSVSSYEPIRPSRLNNTLDEYINSNFDLVQRYSTSSVPVKGNFHNVPEVDDDIISIEEVELFPNKNKHYMRKKAIKFPKRNSLVITPQVANKYYIPKDFPSKNSFIRLPARTSEIDNTTSTIPLNTVSYYNRKQQFNPTSSYRIDFPYDNNNDKTGIYSTKIYRINLNDKKLKKKKIF